ncbi:glutaredoxin family protein [Bacillus sp. T33-2]|uniref:glutaredoxin family protein n=1 Tax=Bacillus sp. T33-2 TaxID=2054168 RepID=UPI000C76D381|nr:glutaredoxin family protein [Bacillus sp. T33-2]PLR99136.1 NrdH-redoxin [Bacillus sp. T33-2]
MNKVKLYSRERCHLCETAREILSELQKEWSFELEEIDIDQDDDLTERYGIMIPVVELDGEEIEYGRVNKFSISKTFSEKKVEYIG